jgi:Ser/Thr protein kinase RdoA (MazF antagonist)
MSPPRRTARLVLIAPDGGTLGATAAFPVATPWWQDVAPVVAAARARLGFTPTILRLLRASRAAPPGGEAIYLAEVEAPLPPRPRLAPWRGDLTDQPLRVAYAKPGGPGADLAWARSTLAAIGLRPEGAPAQIRTWNLSSLWRLPLTQGAAWLKVVPPFFAHEGAVLDHLRGEAVPRVLARDGGRVLLEEIPGEDLYESSPALRLAMIEMLVDLQHRQATKVETLLALGAPDWRGAALATTLPQALARIEGDLSPDDVRRLDWFAEGLPARMRALEGCGVPDSLVHADFHPGNVRGDDGRLTLLDWGDCGVGQPLLDTTAFMEPLARESHSALLAHWDSLWRDRRPGCDPERARRLLAPVTAALKAMIYLGFLERIEPAEHPYHRADPAIWRDRALAALRDEEMDL